MYYRLAPAPTPSQMTRERKDYARDMNEMMDRKVAEACRTVKTVGGEFEHIHLSGSSITWIMDHLVLVTVCTLQPRPEAYFL